MYDIMIKIGNSTVQHGPNNNRVYLMKLHHDDFPKIMEDLFDLAKEKGYSKIFAKVPIWAIKEFERAGYSQEAKVPKFYNGEEDVYFMSYFLSKSRKELSVDDQILIKKNIELALSKGKTEQISTPDFFIRKLKKLDAAELAGLYRKVFECYPFPVFEEDYICTTMEENIDYFGAFKDNRLVAASSAEKDLSGRNAEMTDFATHPEFLGNNLSLFLLMEMEKEMKRKDFKTLYTIARALSTGMNITFAKLGYVFTGTLVNNTHIFTTIESMNVWYKHI